MMKNILFRNLIFEFISNFFLHFFYIEHNVKILTFVYETITNKNIVRTSKELGLIMIDLQLYYTIRNYWFQYKKKKLIFYLPVCFSFLLDSYNAFY